MPLFEEKKTWHRLATERDEGRDHNLDDNGEVNIEGPDNYAIIGDKVYTELQEIIRIIVSDKNPGNGYLNISGKNINTSISMYCVIVENYFDCLCTFRIFPQEWNWDFAKDHEQFCKPITVSVEKDAYHKPH